VFAKLAASTAAFAGLSYDTVGFKGLPLATAPATRPKAPAAMGGA
jgi:hypothetical protein